MVSKIQCDVVILECRNSLNLILQIYLNHNKVYYTIFKAQFQSCKDRKGQLRKDELHNINTYIIQMLNYFVFISVVIIIQESEIC